MKIRPLIFIGACCAALFATAGASAAPADSAGLLPVLQRSNDAFVRRLLAEPENPQVSGGFFGVRGTAAQQLSVAMSYAAAGSELARDPALVPLMQRLLDRIEQGQLPDGLWNVGNLDSPPDSAFILKSLCRTYHLLTLAGGNATAPLRQQLRGVLLRAAEGVRTGGVHTPNHRWLICSTLALVNQIEPDPKWIARIDDWLGEGLDIDGDGQWSERSPNYNSEVNNPALLELAMLLQRPALLEPVARNLRLTLYHAEPNGEMETVASRRQDQIAGSRKYFWEYYIAFRCLALRTGDGRMAAAARLIEERYGETLAASFTPMNTALASLLCFPELQRPLPPSAPLPTEFAEIFPGSALVRIRHDQTTATIYGGSDWFAGFGPGSGLATNPTFFKFRKGAAILESVRLTPAFFGTGFFYSRGLTATPGRYVLSQTLNVPYHLPLPAAVRRPQGDYALAPDMGTENLLGRYFSKLDFANRPKQFRTLRTEVVVTPVEQGFELAFEIDGLPGVPVTLELAFRSGGKFTGVEPINLAEGRGRGRGGPTPPTATAAANPTSAAPTYVLKQGHASYTVGNDRIEFGPGSFSRPPGTMEGEAYTWVGGSLRVEGDRVYLTGVTPFRHRLTFK